MKKCFRTLLVLFAGTLLIGLGYTQCPAVDNEAAATSVQQDRDSLTKQNRITQAQRNAAAKRAREKGFEAPKIDTSMTPSVTTPAKGGTEK